MVLLFPLSSLQAVKKARVEAARSVKIFVFIIFPLVFECL
jgi:hypothetical protein